MSWTKDLSQVAAIVQQKQLSRRKAQQRKLMVRFDIACTVLSIIAILGLIIRIMVLTQ